MDAMFNPDFNDPLHIRAVRFRKLLSAMRKEGLESGRTCVDEHATRRRSDIFEGVDRLAGHEGDASGTQFMPLIVIEEGHGSLSDHKPLVLL